MSQDQLQITILHTNDMHSSLEGMSRLSSYAKDLRRQLEAQGRIVFQFDAGDAADRRERFCGVTKGAAFPRILTAMGYDLQTLGNAISITYGPQAAGEMALRAEYPVLAANMFKDGQALVQGVQPVKVYDLEGDIRLQVIGLTVDAPNVYAIFGLFPPRPEDVTREWIEKLAAEGAGPVIVVSHMGLREDRQLAETVPGIDVIIGGHSHSLLPEGEWVNGTLITQTGNYAEGLGRIDLSVDARTGKVLSKQAVVIPIGPDLPKDPAVETAIEEANREAETLLGTPVAELAQAMELEYFKECDLTNLGADAVRDRMGAEVAILTSGLFSQRLPAGMVTLGDLNSASFSTANPQLSELSGAEIWKALERGLDPEFMQAMYKMFRGAPVGIPAVSGMQVGYNPQARAGERVQWVKVAGLPLEAERLYRVAHTDAEVVQNDPGTGFFTIPDGRLLKVEVPTIVREVLADYLKAHAPVQRPPDGRWVIVNEA